MVNRIDTEKIFDTLSGLHGFSKAINSTLNLEEVEGLILERTARLMHARKVLILLLDETKTTLTLHRSHGFEIEVEVQVKRFHNLKAFDHCLDYKGPVITIDDVLTDEDLHLQRQRMPFLSDMVFVPLEIEGEACGLLGISRDFPEFSTFELEIFYSMGSQAATALKNAFLYKKLYDAFLHTTEALVEIVNSRDTYIGGHT
jgi:GAF domain-containing protein